MPEVCLRDIRTNLRKHTKIPLDRSASTQWRKEAGLCPNGCYITNKIFVFEAGLRSLGISPLWDEENQTITLRGHRALPTKSIGSSQVKYEKDDERGHAMRHFGFVRLSVRPSAASRGVGSCQLGSIVRWVEARRFLLLGRLAVEPNPPSPSKMYVQLTEGHSYPG